MGNDPAFLFYPGDYLRDTQCLSEKSQVAYDRIMCEHMRNICITYEQHNFFTKRLNETEKEELLMTLTKIKGGYCIEWVVLSIEKRKAYSESRRKNRDGKTQKHMLTYDKHMENENEIVHNNRFFKIYNIKHQQYLETYPGIDILHEYKEMVIWLGDNGRKKDHNKFIHNWLKKAYSDKIESEKPRKLKEEEVEL